METEVAKPKIADKSASCHCWMLLAQFQEIAVAFHIRREFAKRTRKGAVLLDLLQKKKSKNQIRSLLEGLKQFSPRQKVFRCREGSMDLLLDPLAVLKHRAQPGETRGIQELRFRRLWADSGESFGFIGLI